MIVLSSLKHSVGPTKWKQIKNFPDQFLLNFGDSQEGLVMFGKNNLHLGKGIIADYDWIIQWADIKSFVVSLTQE